MGILLLVKRKNIPVDKFFYFFAEAVYKQLANHPRYCPYEADTEFFWGYRGPIIRCHNTDDDVEYGNYMTADNVRRTIIDMKAEIIKLTESYRTDSESDILTVMNYRAS